MTGPVPGGPGTGVPDPTGAPATGGPPTQPPATPPAAQPPAAPAPQPAATPPADPASQGDPGQLGDAGKRALEAERQARRDAEAQAKELAAKVQQFEDANKSETQRLAEQAQTAATEAAAANRQLQQMQAALAAAPPGMDAATVANLAGRIQGATPEEMQADAAALFQLAAGSQAPATPAPTAPTGQTTPVEHLKPGALPTAAQPSLDEQIAAATAAGDMATAMALKSQKLAGVRSKQTTT